MVLPSLEVNTSCFSCSTALTWALAWARMGWRRRKTKTKALVSCHMSRPSASQLSKQKGQKGHLFGDCPAAVAQPTTWAALDWAGRHNAMKWVYAPTSLLFCAQGPQRGAICILLWKLSLYHQQVSCGFCDFTWTPKV